VIADRRLCTPLDGIGARHDARDEEEERRADADVDVGALAAQRIGLPGGLTEVVEDLPRRDVAQPRLKPNVQPAATASVAVAVSRGTSSPKTDTELACRSAWIARRSACIRVASQPVARDAPSVTS
jgi:hypothetical protein